ncbi:MAG: hypothetical protein HC837_15550, partial [Chloroflexaceae bacterium]|nr:hypothetical protein [Chloroflexaceae bacterium]
NDPPQSHTASGSAGHDPQPAPGAAPSRPRGRQVPPSPGGRTKLSTSNRHSGNIHQRGRKQRKR